VILSDTAIKRPVSTLIFTAGIMIFGYIAFTGMGVDLFPEVEFPTVTVTAILRGADPEIIDTDVTEVLEEEINTIEGVKTIRSTSIESLSQIVVEFDLSKDVDVAAQEVRDRVSLARRSLPLDLESPIVQKLDIAALAIMWVAVTSPGDYRLMADYAEYVLKEQIQAVKGVGAVQTGGLRDRQIRIWLDPKALEARGLTALDVARAIRAKHMQLPAGRIDQPDKEFVIKVKGEYESPQDLKNLVIKIKGGALVRLKDVAEVVDGAEDLRTIARYNGLPAIGLGVRKQSGTNTVAVANRVKARIEKLAGEAPEGIKVEIAFDQSRFIENSMDDVIRDLFLGAILTALVMLVFVRNFRMTFIAVMAIPTSIIASFVIMYWLGFTINNMTMLAMSLAIGIVIDDAIVVMENIYRHVEQGKSPMEAARFGADQVALAVLAASSSIMAVFFPVAFMKGLIGRFFFQFGLTVALSVLISVILGLTLTPMLCSRLLKLVPTHGSVFRFFEKGFLAIESGYAKALDTVLRHRWVTLTVAFLIFVSGVSMVPFVKKEFITQPDESRFMMRFEFPTGTSIYKTDEGARRIERLLFSQPEVISAFSAVGFGGQGVNSGLMMVNLTRTYERKTSQTEVMARLRKQLKERISEARISVEAISPMGAGQRNADIEYIIQGPSVEELDKVSSAILNEMRETSGFVDVDSNLRLVKPEVRVSINRDLADNLGVDARTIAENFYILFGGQDVAKFEEGGKRFDIRLMARPDARANPDDLYQIVLRSSLGKMIRTPNLVELQKGVGPASINRHNRRRAVTLFANLDGIPMGEGLGKMHNLAAKHIPRSSAWSKDMAGRSDVFAESFRYLLYAVGVAVLLVYMILGSQFESFIHPFTIMMSVPLAVVGGFGFLLLTNKSLDIFSFIGFIMLIGVVTKNAILLVDYTNQLRRRGMSREEALRRAGPVRLRPILMTAFTTTAAVVPVALAISEGGEQRAPMGVAVIGGMLTSTFLTLLIIPCVYTVMDDVSRRFGARFAQKAGATGAGTENSPGASLQSEDDSFKTLRPKPDSTQMD